MHRSARSPEENELYDLLVALIEKLEQKFYQPGSDSNPHSMLQLLREQPRLSASDLVPALGSESIAAERLAGDLKLLIAQIKASSALFKGDLSVFT